MGLVASVRGQQAEAAESLADSVGSNNPDAANHLYAAAELLREDAEKLRETFRRSTPPGGKAG